MGLQSPSAPWVFLWLLHWGPCAPSNGWLWASTSVFARHWQSFTGDSYIRLLSAGSCWHQPSVWIWLLFMGWIPKWGSLWMVIPSGSAPNFVSVTPSMGILFPILRRNEVSTLWSSFLSFMCFANCILGILSFWANIHLEVSAYHVSSFVIRLPH